MTPILVCLHGWGGSSESFTELRQALTGTDIEILTPDLPGFGAEREPDRPWDNDDYAWWTEQWIERQLIERGLPLQAIHLLGHSHGGRIALKTALRLKARTTRARFSIAHLYLCAAAGIRQHDHLKRALGYALAKVGDAVLSIPGLSQLKHAGRSVLYSLLGVHDYERASPIMQQTLQLVRQEVLLPSLPSIDIPTDIFWGTDDRMTPIGDAHAMNDAMTQSTLHVFPGVRHRVHRDKAQEIANVIRQCSQ